MKKEKFELIDEGSLDEIIREAEVEVKAEEKREHDDVFGDPIYVYTRKEAIEDGVLIDLTENFPDICKAYKWPVACTAGVWAIIERATNKKTSTSDLSGVVHDVIWMSQRYQSQRYQTKKWETGAMFLVKIGRKNHTFKIVSGPGDNAEPVLTIMLPEED
jgi:hypothetical protein